MLGRIRMLRDEIDFPQLLASILCSCAQNRELGFLHYGKPSDAVKCLLLSCSKVPGSSAQSASDSDKK
jgi:hypothetical protein